VEEYMNLEHMDLPPGFRFHPTDEELVTHYLSNKVSDEKFVCRAVADVDLNKCEPWDLPWRAKMGEKEWYFFCVRDRKYPTGLRTNRATEAGYWKATGKDKEIYRGRALVGMKKTLVFYRGRAPRGEKTNWVMHEYRMESTATTCSSSSYNNFRKPLKNCEWVLCRVFQKNIVAGGKKAYGNELGFSLNTVNLAGVVTPTERMGDHVVIAQQHVPCFSNTSEEYFDTNGLFSTPDPFSMHTIFSGEGACKVERDVVTVSQETGVTSDANPEISSVFSNHETGKQRRLDSGEILPSNPAHEMTLDDCYFRNY